MKERRLEPFYHDPCVYPLSFREKGNVDHKTIMGVALTRCLCPNIKDDLWNITYEPGKYGRDPKTEFMRIMTKVQRLYSAFNKNLVANVDGQLVFEKSIPPQPSILDLDIFSGVFKTRGEKENEVNAIVKQWVKAYKGKARIGVVVPQLRIVSDLIFSVDEKTVAIEIMRYLSGVRGSWIIAKLRTLGALTTPMELERYGLVDLGGVLLAHRAQGKVVTLAEHVVEAATRIREYSSYFQREFPIVGLVDLMEKKLETYDFSQRNWLQRDFSLLGLSILSIAS